MKRFKKKHTKLPKRDAVVRLLRYEDPSLVNKYVNTLNRTPELIPLPIREACLAEFDPARRSNIRYYPDLHNFKIYEVPNRSLPIPKFLAMWEKFVDPEELKRLEHDLTNYRLIFGKTEDEWLHVYADGNVHSCMAGSSIVRCYAHPQNKLAIAALYAPGGNTLVARTIVNTDEKWYVRLFGDKLLVDKLQEQGYTKLSKPPNEFRMYAAVEPGYVIGNELHLPYFDFQTTGIQPVPGTYDALKGLVEILVNPGIH